MSDDTDSVVVAWAEWAKNAYWAAATLFMLGFVGFPNEQAFAASAVVIALAGIVERRTARAARTLGFGAAALARRALVVAAAVPLGLVGWLVGWPVFAAGTLISVFASRRGPHRSDR